MTRMTRERRQAILCELKKAINTRADRRPGWFHPDKGLCFNFRTLAEMRYGRSADLVDVFDHAIRRWPLWTGDNCYIIPQTRSSGYKNSGLAYETTGNKYDRRNPYNQLRHELLDFLIDASKGSVNDIRVAKRRG